jgi:phosphatidylserine/phosphatidylglycerophosphate/cardiolipin synthase-like enzyme
MFFGAARSRASFDVSNKGILHRRFSAGAGSPCMPPRLGVEKQLSIESPGKKQASKLGSKRLLERAKWLARWGNLAFRSTAPSLKSTRGVKMPGSIRSDKIGVMANTGVRGQVLDTDGNPMEGFLVYAFDVEVTDHDEPLSYASTDNAGNYSITYSKWAYGLERRPDIRLRVYGAASRLVYESIEYPDVDADTFNAPVIRIPKADAYGYLVTLLTGSSTLLSQGNAVKVLVDNKQAWEELITAVQKAQIRVACAQLMIDVGKVFTVFTPEHPPLGSPTQGLRPEDVILEINKSNSVSCYLVINDFIGEPEFLSSNTVDAIKSYFGSKMPNTVNVQPFRRAYNKAMHAKFTAIEGDIVVVNASPILQEYFDDISHAIDEPRRGTMHWLGNQIRVPVHDVSFSVKGPAVEHLQSTFVTLWSGTQAGFPVDVLPATPLDPGEAVTSVQIVRTLPGNLFKTGPGAVPDGELGILEAYQRAIGEAKDLIYFENQYFTSPLIPSSLLWALKNKPNLEIILLGNNKVDIPPYQTLQTSLFQQFLKDVEDLGVKDRVGIFTRWTHDSTASPQRIIRNYVHSKAGVVDDLWATIGSANLDGVSIYVSQHLLFYCSKNDLLEERAIEVNGVIYNGVDGQAASDIPGALRKTLWSEHLGLSGPQDQALQTKPAHGWVSLWKNAANAKAAGLKASPPTGNPANILEWQGENKPKNFLKKLGITPSKDLTIETSVKDFSFKDGTWH